MKNKLILFFSVLLLGIMVLNLIQCKNEGSKNEKNIQPLLNSWDKALPHQEIPKGLTSLSAKQCGACHPKHYKEWKFSTHSHAWTDLQFQAELKKETSPIMCINCHIPLQNQQEYIVEGYIDGDIYKPAKKKNPYFDKNLQNEGITCVSCHLRNNVIVGPTGTKKAPHKTVKDKNHLSEKLCISCHNAVAVVTPTLACSFETGDEWKTGSYFGKKNCISCHMESVNRSIVPGYEPRLSHFHTFPGSGIPKFDSLETKSLEGLGYYPTPLKTSYKIGDIILYSIKLKNEFAGHRLPTGDPERFYLINFELIDEPGNLINTKTDRIGEHWEWHPLAKKVSDNNLNLGEERNFNFSYKLQEKGKYKLRVKITKHRASKESAEYNKLGKEYPLFIVVFEEEYNFVVN